MASGAGLYFDGTTSARHAVTVEAAPETLRILGADGSVITAWPYSELRAQSSPADVMRLRRAGGPELARLEIRDAALIAQIDQYADSLDRAGTAEMMAPLFGLPPEELAVYPHACIGSVEEIVESLQYRRERWDASYVVFQGDTMDAMAPVVAALRDT